MPGNRPSAKQIGFLKKLGYDGDPPQTIREASAAIDEMLSSGDSAKAQRAIVRARKESASKVKRQAAKRVAEFTMLVREMVRENQNFGGDGLYAGFMLVAIDPSDIEAQDRPYLNAFVPIGVAEKNPEILAKETLLPEDVLVGEPVINGIKCLVSPDAFKVTGAWFPLTYPITTEVPDFNKPKHGDENPPNPVFALIGCSFGLVCMIGALVGALLLCVITIMALC